jgi:hypothetical protein
MSRMTTNITPQADRMIRHAAHNLIHLAAIHGLLPTLETQPRQPLAMGNHGMRFSLRPVRNPDPAAADNCRRPDLLEKLTYHEGVRHDMSLEDCLSFLADGWKEAQGRSYTQLVLQLTELLAAAPSKPYCWSDCTAYTAGIEGELQALRKKVATYEARAALGLMPTTGHPGWKWVPVDPTGVMKDCGAGSLPIGADKPWAAGVCYRAMVAAAPEMNGES